MQKIKLLSLSFLTGLLLSVSWPYALGSQTWLIFFAWLPLLFVEQSVRVNKQKSSFLFLNSVVAFFTWNLIAIWWVKNASMGGAIMAVLSNTLFMTFAFQLYHVLNKKFNGRFWLSLFIVTWLSFEYVHSVWELAYPWLTIGNVFALEYKWVQWYEYTGLLGGTFWVLLVSGFWFITLEFFLKKDFKQMAIHASVAVILIIFPIVISAFIYSGAKDENISNKINVVVVQPNIDPYEEKFSGNYVEQLNKMLSLAFEKVDSTTDYIVFPETALQENTFENDMSGSESLELIRKVISSNPKLKIVIGANTARFYEEGEIPSATARKSQFDGHYYDEYNTGLQIDVKGVQIYHKSQLVPGVERMPFPALLKPLEQFAIDLGGSTGSYGIQEERSVFVSPDNTVKVAPVICFESVFGEYVTEYVKNGANVIFIITNDGWWGNTPGYSQHMIFGRLRAIETRRAIARSANTGTSCFINKWGDISQNTEWWQPAVIQSEVELNNEMTFYTRHGDFIGRVAVVVFILLFIYYLYLRIFSRKLSEYNS